MALQRLATDSKRILAHLHKSPNEDAETARKNSIKLVGASPGVVLRISGFVRHDQDKETMDRNFPVAEALRALEGHLNRDSFEQREYGTVGIRGSLEDEDGSPAWPRPPTRGKRVQVQQARGVIVNVNDRPTYPALVHPDRVRRGTHSRRQMTTVILSGTKPTNDSDIPVLAFLKIHELKALKTWLAANTALKRSGFVSRMEKVLQLIFLLQYGCRFERIACWFSCSPRKTYRYCIEVFNAFLELHRQTTFPPIAESPLYVGKWRVLKSNIGPDGVARCFIKPSTIGHYPWLQADLFQVIRTLNIWIGRFRAQGQCALSGPVFPWGDVEQTGLLWIEAQSRRTAARHAMANRAGCSRDLEEEENVGESNEEDEESPGAKAEEREEEKATESAQRDPDERINMYKDAINRYYAARNKMIEEDKREEPTRSASWMTKRVQAALRRVACPEKTGGVEY